MSKLLTRKPHPNRISDEEYRRVEALLESGHGRAEVARMTGYSLSRVKRIHTGEMLPPPDPTVTKKCLSCTRPFDSWGAGNRMCDSCRANDGSDHWMRRA